MVFLIGFVIVFIGIVKIVNAKHQFNLFYDQRDRKIWKNQNMLETKIGIILTVIGIVMIVASFFIERL